MAGNATLNTSVSVPFSTGETGSAGGTKYVLEASNRPPIVPKAGTINGVKKAYFLVFPGAGSLNLVTTSGSANSNSSGLSKYAEDTLTFSASSVIAELRYPGAASVKIAVLGNLVPAGGTGGPTVKFDAAKNAVVASEPCYGNVRVSYQAPHDLWLASFDSAPVKKGPLPLKDSDPPEQSIGGPNPDDDVPSIEVPLIILAHRKVSTPDQDPNEVVASLTLSPPPDDTSTDEDDENPGGKSLSDSGAALPKLRFEMAPDYPPRLLPIPKGTSTPRAGCSVWVVPAVQPSIDLTAGQIVAWATVAGEPVIELLTFNNSMSQTLRYQPAGSVSMQPMGTFKDKWGNSMWGNLRGPGSTCTVVEWMDEHTFKNPRSRTVLSDEIVACDMFGNCIPCYGAVKVTYSFTYKVFDYLFDWDYASRSFKQAFIVGSVDQQVANIMLTPPTMKGIK